MTIAGNEDCCFLGQRGHQNVCATWLAACCPVRSFYPHTHFTAAKAPLTIAGHLIKNASGSTWEWHTCVCLISSPLARWYNGIWFHLFQRKSQIRLHFETFCIVNLRVKWSYICCIHRNPVENIAATVAFSIQLVRQKLFVGSSLHTAPWFLHTAAVVCAWHFTSRCTDSKEGGRVWRRLIEALTIPPYQLPPSCGRQRAGVAASLQTACPEARRCASPLPPSAGSALPAGRPRSYTMLDRIKVTFLAVTGADNLSHEFNMLWEGADRMTPANPCPPSGFDGWGVAGPLPSAARLWLEPRHRDVYFHNDAGGVHCGPGVYI